MKKDTIIKFIKNNKTFILIMLLYTIITIPLLINHEPWRDEAQAWLIGRDLSIINIFKQMYYEGHPCLWNLILSFFAKLNLPYFTINIISYLIMWFTAVLILKKSPFNKFINYIIIFSSPFIYNYSIIARNYCLIPLAISLIAIIYPNRHKNTYKYTFSILFLAWTHIIMSAMAAILYFIYLYEEIIINRKTNIKEQKKKIYISLTITIIIVLLYVIPIGLGVFQNPITLTKPRTESFYILNYISNIIFQNNKLYQLLIISTPVILFIIYEIIYYRKNLIIFLITISYQIFVYYKVYSLSYQRCDIFIFIFIFFLWIQKEKHYKSLFQKKFYYILSTTFIILLLLYSNGYKEIIRFDMKYNYSEAKQTAKYINNNIKDNSLFIALDMPQTSAIIPYINKNIKFYGLDTNKYFTYVTWNYKKKYFKDKDILKILNTKFKNKKNIYIIESHINCGNYHKLTREKIMKLIYISNYSEQDSFCIFEVIKN